MVWHPVDLHLMTFTTTGTRYLVVCHGLLAAGTYLQNGLPVKVSSFPLSPVALVFKLQPDKVGIDTSISDIFTIRACTLQVETIKLYKNYFYGSSDHEFTDIFGRSIVVYLILSDVIKDFENLEFRKALDKPQRRKSSASCLDQLFLTMIQGIVGREIDEATSVLVSGTWGSCQTSQFCSTLTLRLPQGRSIETKNVKRR